MHESLSLTTTGGTEAAARVRAALVALNGGLGERREDVRLLVSEIVTNAVVHAGVDHERLLQFTLSAAPDKITAELEYPGEPFVPRPRPEERHFGLYLVDKLADDWGVERRADKNRVWFEISR
jgi:anti-sigma regulatory factor (Ser/Thr protein kinase)